MKSFLYSPARHIVAPTWCSLGALIFLMLVLVAPSTQAQDSGPQVFSATRFDTSIPLRDMLAVSGITRGYPQLSRDKAHDFLALGNEEVSLDDPVVDRGGPAFGGPTAVVDLSFEAMTADKSAAVAGRFAPPDTNGDIGPNHYVQWVNVAAEIYDRTGTSVLGPFAGNQFWAGFGGRCQSTNDGDPIVVYDELADRWMVSQFVASQPYLICTAVSATPDPTGAYHRYEFSFGNLFPDYFKMGAWTDAYYMTTRSFLNLASYQGQQAVAFERSEMLLGNAAQMVVFSIPGGTGIDGWIPADFDGPAPPANTPGIFGGRYAVGGVQQIRLYELDVDWVTPASSTLSLLATLTEAPYSFSTTDVTQPAPGETLDRLAHFTMYRMQYRNFGTHETLVSNHSVQDGGRAAPRWFELRSNGGGPWGIHQQGTYAPADNHHRWMGSIAMNGQGEIALGYSASSSTLMPSVWFTGQTAAMSGTGIMDVPETEIHPGTGVQTSTGTRWGDYSMMGVDPVGDEQFWYTQEYYSNTASFDWKTRVGAVTISEVPVELVSFGATVSGSDVNLNWFTSSETNNSGFEVQLRGTGDYEAMGFVSGHGTTTVEQSYSYTISDLSSGTYTARLKQIDFDGAFEYSPQVEIAVGVPGTHVLTQAYPNPFNPQASFSLSVAAEQHVEVALYNAIGQQVATLFSGQMEAGQARAFTINGANLPSGPYYYRAVGQTFTESGRVTLLK